MCCGHHFCESCLNKWLDQQLGSGKRCPHCSTEREAFQTVLNKGLRSEINQLEIKCDNHSEGCKWRGELGTLEKHLESDSGCDFADVECPNKCQECDPVQKNCKITVVKRKDLNSHLSHYCYLRPYQCEFCGLKDTYKAITGIDYYGPVSSHESGCVSHLAICLEVPLTCPNKCGSSGIKRKNLENHRSKCPQEPVECPFAEAGCKSDLRRHQLEDHMTSSQQQHLMMVMKDFKLTKSELQAKLLTAETKLNQTEAKLVETKCKLKETEARLTDFIAWSNKLKEMGDYVKIKMSNFSEHRRSGNVWHSPPFYYREGYKMCLAVYANGVGKGAGTHVSVSVLLVGGENDDRLKWPMKCCDKVNHYIRKLPEGRKQFRVCFSSQRLALDDTKKIGHYDKFCDLTSGAFKLVNDSLFFKVEFEDCYLIVNML